MKSFTLKLQDATHAEEITDVTSFVGEDASGSFGILAGHARMMASLIIGLARIRFSDKTWQYLALPGAVLYFHDNLLTISTRHYLRDDDYIRISQALNTPEPVKDSRFAWAFRNTFWVISMALSGFLA